MTRRRTFKWSLLVIATVLAVIVSLFAQSATSTQQKKLSYMPVGATEDFRCHT